MDKKDLKILRELDKDPRASFNQIGKASLVGKEAVQYRVKQMEKKGIITSFFAYIDTSKLGYQTNKVLIKYKSVTTNIQNEIISYVKKSEVVAWAGLCEGTWDLIITTISPSSIKFVEFFNSFFNKFGKYFIKKEVLIPIDSLILNEKYLSEGKLLYKKNMGFHSKKEKIDETDRKILREISLDSRINFTEIGTKLGLSYWTISQRYKRLLEKEIVILLKPRIDFRKLDLEYYHLFIELNNNKIREEIVNYYSEQENCVMLMNHIGSYSLHLEFVVSKKEEMPKIILDLREKFGDKIQKYEPLFIVEEYVLNLLK